MKLPCVFIMKLNRLMPLSESAQLILEDIFMHDVMRDLVDITEEIHDEECLRDY